MSAIIAAQFPFPVIVLHPLEIDPDRTLEDMIGGLPHNNPGITSDRFAAFRNRDPGRRTARLLLARPLQDRQHLPLADVLRRLDQAALAPVDLEDLAALAGHADELWAAGVRFVACVGGRSVAAGPDGDYLPYLILHPEDRGFQLHWMESEWGGPTWFAVERKS